MPLRLPLALAVLLAIYGCGSGDSATVNDSTASDPAPVPDDYTPPSDTEPTEDPAPTSSSGNSIAISSENASIQFVGTHTGDEPDPRTGHFEDFTGSADVDAASGTLQAVSVEIQTASLSTPIENLTTHLKSPDFFDVREHETATFESTTIVSGGDETMISGNLTLLGETKEISFPADVTVADGDLTLSATFSINRSEFGMDYGLDRVHDAVELTIQVGGAE